MASTATKIGSSRNKTFMAILIPVLVIALMKTGAVPVRYPNASPRETTVG